jgi:hypothetical protein
MSEVGQNRKSRPNRDTSALPLIPDTQQLFRHVRKVPDAEVAVLIRPPGQLSQ